MKIMNTLKNMRKEKKEVIKTLEEIRVEKLVSAIANKICALVALEIAEYSITLLTWSPLEREKPEKPQITLSFIDFSYEGQKNYLQLGTKKVWEGIPQINYPLMEAELLRRGWTKSKVYAYTMHYEAS